MRTFLLSLLLFAAGTSTASAQYEELPSVDQTLVIINDQILTESMVGKIAQRLLASNPDVPPGEAGAAALNIGIRRILYLESFKRLGLEEGLLDPQVANRIQSLILEDGSRQRFLEKVQRDGYTSIEDFQAALRHQFIEGTVVGIVSGTIPSPNEGMRKISSPTPAAMREAYASNEMYRKRPAEFEWATLKFLNDPTMAPAADRAAETLNRLGANLMSIPSALAKADKVTTFTEIRPGSREDLKKFLETAAPGECMELSSSVSGVIQLVLVTKRTEAREFSFPESQLLISQHLTKIAQDNAVQAELTLVWQSAYVWITTELPWLRDSIEMTFGEGKSSEEAYEL